MPRRQTEWKNALRVEALRIDSRRSRRATFEVIAQSTRILYDFPILGRVTRDRVVSVPALWTSGGIVTVLLDMRERALI